MAPRTRDPYRGDPGGENTPPDPSDWFTTNAPPATSGFFDAAGTFNGDYQGYFNSLIAGKPATSDTLRGLAADLQKAGITIEPANAAGASSKIKFPDGRVVRVGNYFDGGGTPSWGWTDQPGAAGGGSDPFSFNSDQFNSNPFTSAWPGSFPTFTKAPAFTPTMGEDIYADPGYKFRLGEGEKALQQSAAARGLLNTGGTAKDLIGYGQSFASNEFNNVDQRRRGDYTLNYGTQVLDPYQNAYKNAMDSYNVWRNRQNDSWSKVFQSNTAV